ncbi:acyl-CoA N-acyltransferase [Xylariomycetidae sp. FL0641]|nr:acyl-CoA N-acyltransferase [Xylariomycetidae sp. FL0641]
MSPGVLNAEATVGSGGPRQKSKANADTLRVGCIAMVEKDGQARRAEILSIKDMKSGRHYYCNFDNFNKRLDEWVPVRRIDFEQDVEWPNPDKDKPKEGKGKNSTVSKKKTPSSKAQKRPGKREQSQSISEAVTPLAVTDLSDSQTQSKAPSTPRDVEIKAGETPGAVIDELGIDEMDIDEDVNTPDIKKEEPLSRKQEIEKLRTGGSMTQNPTELARIRNISKVSFGPWDLFPWYFSPYPESLTQEDVIFICEFCLRYYGDKKAFSRHRQKCTLQHPPGNEIYRDDYVSFFEIDGRRQQGWCRNLCLFCKMFLDHKTLFYDVDPFLFYVMTQKSEKGHHLVGFFSKEKECSEGYNVACILTLPQYQRKGFGRLLIQFSYELSKIEGKLGSPEKPLSDLGLLSYRQYWSENILDLLMEANERDEKSSIEQISNALAMTTQDVEHTLQALKMQVYHKGEHKLVIPEAVVQQWKKSKQKQKRYIQPERIQWKPPVFTASSRTWGW